MKSTLRTTNPWLNFEIGSGGIATIRRGGNTDAYQLVLTYTPEGESEATGYYAIMDRFGNFLPTIFDNFKWEYITDRPYAIENLLVNFNQSTINSNSTKTLTTTISIPSGYTVINVTLRTTGYSGVSLSEIYYTADSGVVTITLYNHLSSNVNVTPSVVVSILNQLYL